MRKVLVDNIEYEDFSIAQKIMKKFIFNPFINHAVPPKIMKEVLRNSKSDLAKESLVAPGSWLSMQISYENKPAKDWIDKIVLEFGSFPIGLRNRKKLVVSELSELIKRYNCEKKHKVLIVGIGAGLAINAMEAMKKSRIDKVEGYFVDLDDKAIEPGHALAEDMGLSDKVKFIKGNAIHLKDYIPEDADILKLIGIIEYLNDEQVLELMKVGYDNLHKDGSVITHSIEPAHGIDPFLRKVFNLHLHYRSPQKVLELLQAAGFKLLNIKKEPLGIYHVITALKE